MLRHQTGVTALDPSKNFAARELSIVDPGVPATWDVSFLDVLIDTRQDGFLPFTLDLDALEIMDPGYSGPADAVLLPDRRRVAVMIARSPHFAIFDTAERMTRLVPLERHGGGGNAVVMNNELWLIAYDVLCRVNLDTLAVHSSPILQPESRDPDYGFPMRQFVGSPRFVDTVGAWLVPRPFSGDILALDPETLRPTASLNCGGKPYDLVHFDGGDLLMLDHPFDVVRSANLRDLKPL
jgi:hypothetical protein